MVAAFLLLYIAFSVQAQCPVIIRLSDWGIQPSDGKNMVPVLKKIFEKHAKDLSIELHFQKGRYDFTPIDSVTKMTSINGFELKNLKNVLIDGHGSAFVFHGKMRPFLIKGSTNVKLKDFSIDWDRPYISQGEIIKTSHAFIDLKIDSVKYPYHMENGILTFIGEGWENQLRSEFTNLHTLYDKDKREILYQTRDNPLGNIFLGKAEIIAKNTIRFCGKTPLKPENGTIVTLYHGRYIIPGIEISYSKNTTIEKVKIYHALSHGVLGERSENISMLNSSMTVNEDKGRVFSIVADASHFVNCKGKIIIDGCTHSGMGDDFINVHGAYFKILRRTDSRNIEVSARGRSAFRLSEVGDELFFVDSASMQRNWSAKIVKIDTLRNQGTVTSYELTMDKNIPENIGEGHYLENKTWTASLELRNCRILKKHRARGILVTTPKDVIIENNYFNTAGAAILIEGDLNYWFESGANRNVLIRNNVFEDCLTSGPEWGEAVITITPSIKAKHQFPYHQNIKIRNNIFRHFDRALLFARSVQNLSFTNNKVYKTNTYHSFSKHPPFLLDACKQVQIRRNELPDDFKLKNISLINMENGELRQDLKF
ncbi:right-handed parallel beta-helix repeat-containing protein [Pedobacter sp. HMWF019]|uniref:right-handed parallel beta-helix repeat-containing protein n=1 Tax=Pedobacter sp. HMWF019 TaxID=2056856 RepID=UPI0013049ADF|nr:right-handed parallel beta-helix repeat-containing protein [Pedobacter sp. HMWF019]